MGISASLSYYLAPLAFITYHNAVFEESTIIEKAKSCLLLFVISFAIYLFIVFIFFLAIYSILYSILNHTNLKQYLINISKLIAIYFPLVLIFLIVPYDLLVNSSTLAKNSDQIITGGMYATLQGGLLYQLLMWFWWPIYTYWEPRNILTFHKYFKEPLSIIAPFLLYISFIYYFIKEKGNKNQIIVFFLILLIMFIFVKGSQAPLGWVYLSFLKYMPFSNVIRTPDNKFAFGIVFSISLLFIFISNKNNRYFIASILLAVIAIQCYPLFTGLAIKGENTNVSRDRIVSISAEYNELTTYINTHREPYGYILSIPSVEFGNYKHDSANIEGHIGLDMLTKLTRLPFAYLSSTGGMSVSAYKDIEDILTHYNFIKLNKFPIKYLLLRKDVICEDCLSIHPGNIPKRYAKVFENDLFTMYQNPFYQSMIQAVNTKMNFEMISPMKYAITLNNIKEGSCIVFMQSYRDSWALYPLEPSISNDNIIGPYGQNRLTVFEDLSFLWRKPFFSDTHSLHNGYANYWKLDPAYIKDKISNKYYKINTDGSINLRLMLFNKTQSLFYNTAFITLGYALILLLLIIYKKFGLNLQFKKPCLIPQ